MKVVWEKSTKREEDEEEESLSVVAAAVAAQFLVEDDKIEDDATSIDDVDAVREDEIDERKNSMLYRWIYTSEFIIVRFVIFLKIILMFSFCEHFLDSASLFYILLKLLSQRTIFYTKFLDNVFVSLSFSFFTPPYQTHSKL